MEVLPDVGDQRIELDRRRDTLDPDLGEIVLDEVGHLDPGLVRGIGLQGEADLVPLRVLEVAAAVLVLPSQTRQELLGPRHVVVLARDVRRKPLLVASRALRPILHRLAEQHALDDTVAVDRLGDRAPERHILEPAVFLGVDLRRPHLLAGLGLLHGVEVEPEHFGIH